METPSPLGRIESLTPDDVRQWIRQRREEDYIILDVRQPKEYEAGHIPGAALIPLPELPHRYREVDGSRPVIVYCRSGNRSRSAVSFLIFQGYKEVFNMEGGMTAWNGLVSSGPYKAGLDLLEGRTSLEEVVSLAWTLEDGTGLFYRRLAALVSDTEAGQVFLALADMERRHKGRVLEAYRAVSGKDFDEDVLARDTAKGIMEGGLSVEETISSFESRGIKLKEAAETAMQAEMNSLDLYIRMGMELSDEAAKGILSELVVEEKAHLERIGRLLDAML